MQKVFESGEQRSPGAALGFWMCSLTWSGAFCPTTQQKKPLAQAGGELGAVAGWEMCVPPALGLKELGTITHPVAEGFLPFQGAAVAAFTAPVTPEPTAAPSGSFLLCLSHPRHFCGISLKFYLTGAVWLCLASALQIKG